MFRHAESEVGRESYRAFIQRSARNSSTVMPAWRIRDRRVPRFTSPWFGTVRSVRPSGERRTTWLPFPRPGIITYPAFPNARSTSRVVIIGNSLLIANRHSRDKAILYFADFHLAAIIRNRHFLRFRRLNPKLDRFPDIDKRLFPGFTLAYAPWKTWHFRHKPPILGIRINDDLSHPSILQYLTSDFIN